MNEAKFQKLREQVEELQTEKSKAEGVLESLKKELKKDYGVKTIKEGKALLKKLQKELEEEEAEFESQMGEFETMLKEKSE